MASKVAGIRRMMMGFRMIAEMETNPKVTQEDLQHLGRYNNSNTLTDVDVDQIRDIYYKYEKNQGGRE